MYYVSNLWKNYIKQKPRNMNRAPGKYSLFHFFFYYYLLYLLVLNVKYVLLKKK